MKRIFNLPAVIREGKRPQKNQTATVRITTEPGISLTVAFGKLAVTIPMEQILAAIKEI